MSLVTVRDLILQPLEQSEPKVEKTWSIIVNELLTQCVGRTLKGVQFMLPKSLTYRSMQLIELNLSRSMFISPHIILLLVGLNIASNLKNRSIKSGIDLLGCL